MLVTTSQLVRSSRSRAVPVTCGQRQELPPARHIRVASTSRVRRFTIGQLARSASSVIFARLGVRIAIGSNQLSRYFARSSISSLPPNDAGT
jgi:hypothetical protein